MKFIIPRGNVEHENKNISIASGLAVEALLKNIDCYKLQKVFLKVMKRYQREPNKILTTRSNKMPVIKKTQEEFRQELQIFDNANKAYAFYETKLATNEIQIKGITKLGQLREFLNENIVPKKTNHETK